MQMKTSFIKLLTLLCFSFIGSNVQAQCDFSPGTVNLTSSGYNTTGHTQLFVLTNTSGVIQQIVSGTASFPGVVTGSYVAYGLNYHTTTGLPAGIVVGANISVVTESSCLDLNTGVSFTVCSAPVSTDCDYYPGTITATSTGFNSDAAFTQQYALVDDSGVILDIQGSPTFSSVASGVYRIYSINHETAEGLSGLSTSSNISGLSSTCFDSSSFRLTVCDTSTLTGCFGTTPNVQIEMIPGSFNDQAGFNQVFVAVVQSGGATMSPAKADGEIVAINTDGDFSALPIGVFDIYAVNYQDPETLATGSLVVGNSWPGAPLSFTCSDVSASVTATVVDCSLLPVEYGLFTGNKNGDYNVLEWTTTMEKDVDYFEIERSSDGEYFEKIGQVDSKQKDVVTQYIFMDKYPINGVSYYRLKQVDLDGKYSYSKTITIMNRRVLDNLKVYPQPAKTSLTIEFESGIIDSDGKVTLLDVLGQELRSVPMSIVNGVNQISVSLEGLPNGMYFISLSKGGEVLHENIKIIKE